MKIKLKRAVESFQSVTFLQPLLEAIVNSIEANATQIAINLKYDEHPQIDSASDFYLKMISIIDDGDGFTEENIESFSTVYTDHKISYGCKGVGRLAWLKVFKKIDITSYTGNKKVEIPFHIDFIDEVHTEADKTQKNTTVVFSHILADYYKESKNIEIDYVKDLILQNLAVKLYLLSQRHRKISIDLTDSTGNKANINDKDLMPFYKKNFFIDIPEAYQSDSEEKKIPFELFFCFDANTKNKHEHWLCGHERTVQEIKNEVVTKSLPNNTSSYFLVCSPYLDKQVTQERTEFYAGFTKSNQSMTSPITIDMLFEQIKNEADSILYENFPTLADENSKIINKASKEYPHLSAYFETNTVGLLNEKSLIKKAKEKFDYAKEKSKKNFSQMLAKQNICIDVFLEETKKVSAIASQELAEYVLYRQQIIDAVKKTLVSSPAREHIAEKFLHDLFMPMGTESHQLKNKSVYDSNLWLLDDKFMGYLNAFSDKKISKIKEKLEVEFKLQHGDGYEPDLVVFYSNFPETKEIVIIELKKAKAKPDEKIRAISELNRNIGHVLRDFDGIRRVYGYIIMQIDEKTKLDIKYEPVTPLFSNSEDPCYYSYNRNIEDRNGKSIDSHTYILSLESIVEDAIVRNKTFLDVFNVNNSSK